MEVFVHAKQVVALSAQAARLSDINELGCAELGL